MIQDAIDAARAGHYSEVWLQAGTYIVTETLIPNGGSADQSPVRIRGIAAPGYALGTSTVKSGTVLQRPTGAGNRIIDALGHGLDLHDLTLDGNGGTDYCLLVERGFQIKTKNVKIRNSPGGGALLLALSDAEIEQLYIECCGTDGYLAGSTGIPALRIAGNSAYEAVSNAVNFYGLSLARNQGVDLDLASGTAGDDYAEFLKIFGLHIESVIDNTSDATTKQDPAILIGNVRGAEIHPSLIYGGAGNALIYVAQTQNLGSNAMTGTKFFGGHVLGHLSKSGSDHVIDASTPPRLVHLVSGDEFEWFGGTFDTATTEHVKIESTFGTKAWFPGAVWRTRAGASSVSAPITDLRSDDATHRAKFPAPPTEFVGDVKATSAAGARLVEIDTASGQTGAVRLETAGVARWDLRKSSTAESGSNVGSDLEVVARSDTGASLFTVLQAIRRNGLVGAPQGFVQKAKSGVPVDGDWPSVPPAGTTVLDDTNGKLYIRTTAGWKSVTLS